MFSSLHFSFNSSNAFSTNLFVWNQPRNLLSYRPNSQSLQYDSFTIFSHSRSSLQFPIVVSLRNSSFLSLACWFGYQRWSQMSSLYFCEKPRKCSDITEVVLFLLLSRLPFIVRNICSWTPYYSSIIKQKCKKNLDSYCFVTSLWLFIWEKCTFKK